MFLFLFIILLVLNFYFLFLLPLKSSRMIFILVNPILMHMCLFFVFLEEKVIFYFRMRREEKKMRKEILRFLSSVKSYLQVGLLVPRSLEMTSRQRRWCVPIEHVLMRVLQGCQHGKSLEESLNSGLQLTIKKTSYQYLHMFLSVLRLAHKTGGNTIAMLDRVQVKISDHLYLRQKFKTLTAQMRLQAGVILASPWVLALIIYVLSPSYILFFVTHFLGIVLLILMLVLNAFAFLSLFYILRIR